MLATSPTIAKTQGTVGKVEKSGHQRREEQNGHRRRQPRAAGGIAAGGAIALRCKARGKHQVPTGCLLV